MIVRLLVSFTAAKMIMTAIDATMFFLRYSATLRPSYVNKVWYP